ncbi:MAG TPA: hypothetical protein ENK18_28480 [Deltaproteobacteria bacterium]|nr:hypothetical protein [Deltaproteobacteria bacterium]
MIWLLRVTIATGMLLAGVAMLVLPGPGLLTIAAALAWLEREVPAVARRIRPLRRRVLAPLGALSASWGRPIVAPSARWRAAR